MLFLEEFKRTLLNILSNKTRGKNNFSFKEDQVNKRNTKANESLNNGKNLTNSKRRTEESFMSGKRKQKRQLGRGRI